MNKNQKLATVVRSHAQRARPTIGLLTGRVSGERGTTSSVLGTSDAAEERDANVIAFVGESLRSPHGFEAQGTVLYDLVMAGVVEGVVVDGGWLGHYVGPQALQDFCGRYRDVPVVSVEVPLEGIPSVSVDFYQGMRHLIDHLIEVHGYRRIAFIRGPEESLSGEERYRAYQDALAEHGIPLDLDLVAPGTFFEPSGAEAVRLLLDERKVAFEAIAAANDFMAVDALQALQARGIRVPGDVAVTGYDNEPVTSVVTPPLTTARLENYERMRRAAEMLLDQLEGKEVPEWVVLPAELVVRQSCGCPSRAVVEAASGPARATGEAMEVALHGQREQILSEMAQGVGASAVQVGHWAEQLLEALSAELGGQSTGAFLSTLADMLNQTTAVGGEVTGWHGVLSALRRHAVPSLGSPEAFSRAENLWQQARVMIGEAAERTVAYRGLQSERQAEVLRQVGQVLITTHDVAELMDTLVEQLPQLGIKSCYLSLYEDPGSPAEWSRLVLAYRAGERVGLEEGGRRFASRQLVPEGLWPADRRYLLIIEPLYFREDQIGFALFEFEQGVQQAGSICEALRGQLSSALQGALLVQRVREHSAELARQQYILDTFMENVPDRIYFKDLQGCITRSNKAHAIWMRLSDPAEEIGKSDWDFFSEEQVRVKSEQDQAVIRSGQPLSLEEEHVRPDGRAEWVLTTKMPLRDEHGHIIGTFGISRDITELKQAQATLEKAYAEVEQQVQERTAQLQQEIIERKQIEAALAQERNLLRTLVDNLPGAVFVKDLAGRKILSNKIDQQYMGVATEAEALGKTDFDVYPEEAASLYAAEDQAIFQTGEPMLNREDFLVESTGHLRYVLVSKLPLRNPAGQIVGLLGINHDITERKRAEEALQESEQRFRTLAEASFEGIALTERGVLVDLNDQLAYMLGYPRSELIGQPVTEVVAPESRALVAEAIDSGRLEPYEHLALRKDGTAFPVEARVRTTQMAGRQLRFNAIRDITERKRAEAEREKLIADLEAKNAELERFTYTVSHDLKSPLVTITGFLGYLEKDALAGRVENVRADSQRIAQAAEKMQRLLDELLELSRIGRMTNLPVEVAFGQIVREAVDLVQGRIMARGVQVDIADNLPTVYGDQTRLVEAVQNLVDNAVKFMGDQAEPRITIGTPGVERSGMPIFFVQDNGIGIEPEYHERVFGLFNKLDAQSEGTGVGLALVRRIIEVHGGQIWVESDGAGQGSTFFFTLPRPTPSLEIGTAGKE